MEPLVSISGILTKKDLNGSGVSIPNCADYPKHMNHVSIHAKFPAYIWENIEANYVFLLSDESFLKAEDY